MKKITLVSIATLALFLGGCAQQESESKPSQEQSTEQTSSETANEKVWNKVNEVKERNKAENAKEKLKQATGRVDGNAPLYEQFANSFQQWTESRQVKIYYFSYALAAVLPKAASEMTQEQIQEISDGLLDIKHSVEKTYQITDKDFTASTLYVFDKDEKRLAVEQDSQMILDK